MTTPNTTPPTASPSTAPVTATPEEPSEATVTFCCRGSPARAVLALAAALGIALVITLHKAGELTPIVEKTLAILRGTARQEDPSAAASEVLRATHARREEVGKLHPFTTCATPRERALREGSAVDRDGADAPEPGGPRSKARRSEGGDAERGRGNALKMRGGLHLQREDFLLDRR